MEFKGENRLKKALRIVNKIVPRNPIIKYIDEHRDEVRNALKRKSDRNLILIALLNSSFPFSYEALTVFGRLFSVQDMVNAETIKKTISKSYGGNRATENGIYSVVPMFLEAGLFQRPKQGLYQFEHKANTSHKITRDIYLESFKSNNALEKVQEFQLLEPYFFFLN